MEEQKQKISRLLRRVGISEDALEELDPGTFRKVTTYPLTFVPYILYSEGVLKPGQFLRLERMAFEESSLCS